jgi:hypothetical protein
MPTYATLPAEAKLMQNKTSAFLVVPVSDGVDLGYWWMKTAGDIAGKLRISLLKPNGTVTVKAAEDGDAGMVNTEPAAVKVLVLPADIDFIGNLKIFPEFKIDDSWVQADPVIREVVDDPVPS